MGGGCRGTVRGDWIVAIVPAFGSRFAGSFADMRLFGDRPWRIGRRGWKHLRKFVVWCGGRITGLPFGRVQPV